jgi:hypothetical protein
MLRRCSLMMAMPVLLVVLSSAQADDTVLTLACQGTTTITTTKDTKPEPVSKGIVVDFANNTVQGFGDPLGRVEVPVKITRANEVSISFTGASRVLDVINWSIYGTIDRITGDAEATSMQTNVNTSNVVSSVSYLLKCKPAQRMF